MADRTIHCNGRPGYEHIDRARMKFKCLRCKRWFCGHCHGTHEDARPGVTEAKAKSNNGLCDPCWSRENRKRR